MAVSPFKTFSAGEVLFASDLNSSFTQITNNGEDLGWPATKAKDFDGQELILDSDGDTSIHADTDDQIDFKIGGANIIRLKTVASAVNGIDFIGSATGNGIDITAFGTDANIDVNLNPKGTGKAVLNGDIIRTDPISFTNTKLGIGAGDAIIAGALNNITFGTDALGVLTTGDANTAVGANALSTNVTANSCTAIGKDALLLNTAGNITAVGAFSLDANTSGANNTAVGTNALSTNVTGADNTAVGTDALLLNTASNNTAVGSLALDANSGGDANTAVGTNALSANTINAASTAVGKDALLLNTADNNTAVGAFAGDALTTGENNICIGVNSDTGSATSTNRIVVGLSILGTANDQYSLGKASNVVSNDFGTDAVWTRISDKRKKQNVNNLGLGLDFINNLRPVTYRWKPANQLPPEWDIPLDIGIDTETIMTGLIAQEVEQALIKANTGIRFPGWADTKTGQRISGEAYIFPLINAVNELTERLKKLEEKKL